MINTENQPTMENKIPTTPKGFDINKFIIGMKIFLENLKKTPLTQTIKTRWPIILALFLGIFLLTGIAFGFYIKNLTDGLNKKVVAPEVSPVPTREIEEIINPSKYATDAGVIKIEEDLKSLNGEISTTDLKEHKISPPNFNFNVNFEDNR